MDYGCGWPEQVFSVVAQFGNGIVNVAECRMCRHLIATVQYLRHPTPCQLFDGGNIDMTVMKIAFQRGHLPVHETAILADRIATHR